MLAIALASLTLLLPPTSPSRSSRTAAPAPAAAPTPAAVPAATPWSSPSSSAAPSPRVGRVRVLLLDLTTAGVPPEQVKVLDGSLAAALDDQGVDAVTRADLRTMASVAADLSTAGCNSDSDSCLAELAAALGADLVVSGQVGRLDTTYVLQLSLFDANAGRAMAREELRGQALTLLADRIPDAVARLIDRAPLLKSATTTTASPLVWVGASAIAVGATAAVALGGFTWLLDDSLSNPDPVARDRAFALQAEPWTLAGALVGVAAAATGGVMLSMGLSE